MSAQLQPDLPLAMERLRPGMRVAVGLSGGADSVALLRVLAARRESGGIVLHVAHLHHGLRGAEADGDREFCRELAAGLGVAFHEEQVDVGTEAAALGESIEEAARRVRYAWFRRLMAEVPLDAVVTAHSLDDQAETVLAKLLRGAWTEGLAGIHPLVEFPEGSIVRPLLAVSRRQIEVYLGALGQSWREDGSNRDLAFTRNRIRHELLPQLEIWNPQLRARLAAMAELAREEECCWAAEIERLAAQMILPGKPARGGGRAGSEGLAIELARLEALPVAVQRRLVRHAAARLGVALSFDATEEMRGLALSGKAGQKKQFPGGLEVERSHRELRFGLAAQVEDSAALAEESFAIPGTVESAAFDVRLRVESAAAGKATLRGWKAGDRVRLRYSSAPKKVKEVLERLRVSGTERAGWPVLEVDGRIAWMRGAEVEPEAGVRVVVLS